MATAAAAAAAARETMKEVTKANIEPMTKITKHHTEKKKQNSDELDEVIMLLNKFRGPLIMSLVLGPLVVRYSIQLLSSGVLISVAIVMLGTALTCHDLFFVAEREFRILLHRGLNAVVLDDVLRSIFDPQIGIVPVMTSMMIGNASMYTLPMSEEQRVALMQSCLLTSQKETSEILMAPGGVRQLLPSSVQKWLLNPNRMHHQPLLVNHEGNGETIDKNGEPSEEDMPTDSDTDSETVETSNKSRSMPAISDSDKPSEIRTSDTKAAAIKSEPPPDPAMVMAKILKDLSMDGICSVVRSIPDSWLQGASVAGTLALCLHLRASPRARHIVMGVGEGATAMGFAGVALGGMATLFVKQSVQSVVPSSIRDGTPSPVAWTQVMLNYVKTVAARCKNSKQLRAAIALLALYYFGKVKRRKITNT